MRSFYLQWMETNSETCNWPKLQKIRDYRRPIPKMNIYSVHPFSKVSGSQRRKRMECNPQTWYMTSEHSRRAAHTNSQQLGPNEQNLWTPRQTESQHGKESWAHSPSLEQWQMLRAGRGEAVFRKFLQANLLTIFLLPSPLLLFWNSVVFFSLYCFQMVERVRGCGLCRKQCSAFFQTLIHDQLLLVSVSQTWSDFDSARTKHELPLSLSADSIHADI